MPDDTGMLTRRAPDGADGGFTLVELIVSIAILGVVMAGVTGVMFAALTVNRQTDTRLTSSRDVQFVAAYLADDVQGATSVATGVTAGCGTGTATLELRGSSFDAALNAQATVVSYVLTTTTAGGVTTGTLHRYACVAGAPASDVVVARSLATAPGVECFTAGVPVPCSGAPAAVSLKLTPVSGEGTFSVGGTRRTTP